MAQGQEAWAVVGQVHLCKAGCSHNFGIIFVTWYQGVTSVERAIRGLQIAMNHVLLVATFLALFGTFYYV